MSKRVVGFIILVLCSSCSPIRSNELPMYGSIPRTSEEQRADQQFIDEAIKDVGSRENAFEQVVGAGWSAIYEGDYRKAMRRFNQAWLLDPDHPVVFHGYGSALLKMGKQDEFAKWNKKAAELGYAKSQINMGYAYHYGIGVEKNPEEAFAWYRKAAEQGIPTALHALGVLYDWGYGVDEDQVKAHEWYEKADRQGPPGIMMWKKLRKKDVERIHELVGLSLEEIMNMRTQELEEILDVR